MSIANYPDQRAGLSFRAIRAVFIVLTGLLPFHAHAEYALNLPPPASDLAQDIFDLHTLILWICTAIFVVVFVPMFVALIRHRKSAGHQAAKFHDNLAVEIIWTIVPIVILFGMAWPATSLVISMKDTTKEDLTIKVTGHQWKWEYEYLGDDIRFVSNSSTSTEQIAGRQAKGENYLLEVDRPMVVPAGKKIRLVMTSSDVIHAWWVPAFGVKQDAVPGFIREAWFKVDQPGTYRGQCAELCGKNHGFMPIVVEVKSEADYQVWLAGRKVKLAAAAADVGKTFTPEELKSRGEKIYAANCAACHQPDGKGVPGAFPALACSKVVTGDPATHIGTVLNGRSGTAMAAFKDQLNDADLAAVITWERTSWGNRGTPVQPADVKAQRK